MQQKNEKYLLWNTVEQTKRLWRFAICINSNKNRESFVWRTFYTFYYYYKLIIQKQKRMETKFIYDKCMKKKIYLKIN